MSWWSRIANVCRHDRLITEIDEELESHIEEAIAAGRDPAEARRAFGSLLLRREESRDIRLIAWLDALRTDATFACRQLLKHKVTSAAAVVSLGLAIGACTSAFRLADALLLRTLPVDAPERLYVLTHETPDPDPAFQTSDFTEYPLFRLMREAVGDQAELIAISFTSQTDLTFGSNEDMEKAYRQYVSGWMFRAFGLGPVLGRVLTAEDDVTPGAHPYAVLSHAYWTQRFGQDPDIIGRTFTTGNQVYEIVGVADERFTGTEPGIVTDIFVPAMMHPGVNRADWSWFRTFLQLKVGVAAEAVRDQLQATFRTFRQEVAKQFVGRPAESTDQFINANVSLEPAATGVSTLRAKYSRSLSVLGVLVTLLLLIACANVANLMTAQTAARSREMALRVSLGAGTRRLVQLVLVESLLIASLATALGGLFAWWSAPVVVSMINPPETPVRLALPLDWRTLAFGLGLALGVTCLFGLAPAVRASAVTPLSALKGGADPHSRRRTMHALIAMQVALCVLVSMACGLLVTSFERLATQPTGFSAERVLTIGTVAPRAHPALWDQVAEHLRALPGVEDVALSGWPLMSGTGWKAFVFTDGTRASTVQPYFLNVSPGWLDTMRIPFIDGRDFRASDAYPGAAIVNQAFAQLYFNGENPIGRWFEETPSRGDALPKEAAGIRFRVQIVGLVADARYWSLREPILPTVYVPFRSTDSTGELEPIGSGTFIVRTSTSDPSSLAPMLRQEVTRTHSEFRVSNIRTQTSLNDTHIVRERLLATLALFFAAVAVTLAGVGLYGVLRYSVLQRRRELAIRIALGSRPADITRRVTAEVFSMTFAGVLAGVALGLVSAQYLEPLFHQVKATDPSMLVVPVAAILMVAVVSALPAVRYAVRIDPIIMLREE